MNVHRTPNGIAIPDAAVSVTFARSGGPGGQHVNTSSTKARVTITIDRCGLPDHVAARLVAALGDSVVATSSAQRSQYRNRTRALADALAAIDAALVEDAPRHATKPTRASKERRRRDKERQAARKADRRHSDW